MYTPLIPSPRDWSEDFPHENGCYAHRCRMCAEQFFGHKRRSSLCKVCSERITAGNAVIVRLRAAPTHPITLSSEERRALLARIGLFERYEAQARELALEKLAADFP